MDSHKAIITELDLFERKGENGWNRPQLYSFGVHSLVTVIQNYFVSGQTELKTNSVAKFDRFVVRYDLPCIYTSIYSTSMNCAYNSVLSTLA